MALRRFAGPASYVGKMAPVRVAHVTDLHVGRVTPFAIQREAQALVNAQKPDLVLVTGDFVCHSQLYLDQLEQVMSGFLAPVVAVLGNHDYWAGAEEVCHALRRSGVEVLRNQHTTITVRGQAIQIVGLDDAYTGHACHDRAVAGLRPRRAGARAFPHRRGGRPSVAAWDSAWSSPATPTAARSRSLACTRSRSARSAGTSTCTGSMARAQANDNAGAVYVGAGIGAAVMPLRIGDRGRREVTVFELGVAPGEFTEHHVEQHGLAGRQVTPAQLERRIAKVKRKHAARANRRTVEMPAVR